MAVTPADKALRPAARHAKRKPLRKRFPLAAYIALVPLALTVVFAYLGTMLWSLRTSFTNSRTFASTSFAGVSQYVRLFNNDRWMLSLQNIVIYGVLFIVVCLAIGLLLAVFIDQKVVGEGALRTVFLYPYAMSFVATGLVWQWILNPQLGIQEVLHRIGFTHARFDWIVDQDKVVYTLVIATVWQASGLVMALLLAGLRGIDEEIWKAARIDGIPRWRVYVSIVIPMLGASGAISGVLGGYVVLFPTRKVRAIIFNFLTTIPAIGAIGIWIVYQLILGWFTPAGAGGVAYAAHIGGFVAGAALIKLFALGRRF